MSPSINGEASMETMNQQLLALREQYVSQLDEAEVKFKKLQAEIVALRGRVSAIDTLTSGDTELDGDTEEPIPDDGEDLGLFTPRQDYWKPILQVLVEMGGRGRRGRVIAAVGEKMKGILKPADYGKLPKSGWVRWSNRVAWQASEMRAQGYIHNASPRGIWEITDVGRKWLSGMNT